jgi:hypothetical protein
VRRRRDQEVEDERDPDTIRYNRMEEWLQARNELEQALPAQRAEALAEIERRYRAYMECNA